MNGRFLVIEDDLTMAHFLKGIIIEFFPGCKIEDANRQGSMIRLEEGWDVVIHGLGSGQDSAMFLQKIKKKFPNIMTVLIMGITGVVDDANLIVDYVWASPFEHEPFKKAVGSFLLGGCD